MPITFPLPTAILTGAHSRGALLASGLSESDLRGPTWARVSYGMYAWDAATADLRGRLQRLGSLVPPGGALGGWAAVHLLGAADLDGTTEVGARLPVVVCAGRHETCRWGGREVVVWRSDLSDDDVVQVQGIPITCPQRSGFDVARLSPFTGKAGRSVQDAEEAVVLFDALLRTGTVTRQDVATYAAGHPRRSGARQRREVLANADEATSSCQETRFRRLWIAAAGLLAPVVNQPVADREGRFVAEVDLLDPDAGLVGEYDGAHHAGAARRAADHVRAESLSDLGLTVVRVAAPDLTQFRARTVRRLQSAYGSGLARNRDRDGWTLLHRSGGASNA